MAVFFFAESGRLPLQSAKLVDSIFKLAEGFRRRTKYFSSLGIFVVRSTRKRFSVVDNMYILPPPIYVFMETFVHDAVPISADLWNRTTRT